MAFMDRLAEEILYFAKLFLNLKGNFNCVNVSDIAWPFLFFKCLLLFTCNFLVSVRSGFLFLLVFGMGCVVMPPTLKKWGGGHIGFGLSVCMYVRTYSCSRYRLETSCMDSSWKNSRHIFLVFPELSPLVKLRPFYKQGDEIL